MSDKITLDRETFKVLSADTRIDILKRLEQHKETLTDIADGLKMSPSTIKEHLDRLSQAGLIAQEASDTKWKYYTLTDKGKRILKPYETNVLILLATSALFLGGSLYNLASRITTSNARAPELMLAATKETGDFVGSATTAASVPYFEVFLVVLFAVFFGFFFGRLLRK